jgi:hypothetical protein
MTVGEVQEIPAADIASKLEAYAELAQLGDQLIPLILLNEEFPRGRHTSPAGTRTSSTSAGRSKPTPSG